MTTLTLLLFALISLGGSERNEEEILFLSGASCLEELSESEMERFRSLEEHPVGLNYAGKSRLLSCGLFSMYQVASLLDYRNRNGNILSYKELSLVDGFSEDFAGALKPFTSLESSAATLSPNRALRKLSQNISLTLSSRGCSPSSSDASGFAYRFSYDAEIGSRAKILWTNRRNYSSGKSRLSFPSMAYYFERPSFSGKVVLGNFSAKFGQGVALWSGFRLDSYSSAAAFSLNGNGISPTASALASFCGIAADCIFGKRLSLATGYSFLSEERELFAALNYASSRLSAGLLGTSERASSFFRFALGGASLFGECSIDYDSGKVSSVGGILAVPRYAHKYALLLRYYGSPKFKKYSGVALGADLPWMAASLDCGFRLSDKKEQYRLLFTLKPQLKLLGSDFIPGLRYYGKLQKESDGKPTLRHDLRAEAGFQDKDKWSLTGRYNIVCCKDFAYLWYIQAGRHFRLFKEGSGSVFVRGGTFKVDNWEDRIYAYQKDTPGTFNVPAYYGRGWDVSLYASLKITHRHSLYLRFSHTAYPWMERSKPAKSEVRLMYRIKI